MLVNSVIQRPHMPRTLDSVFTELSTHLTASESEESAVRYGCIQLTVTTSTPQPFYNHFSRTTRVSRCQKRTSVLYGARRD